MCIMNGGNQEILMNTVKIYNKEKPSIYLQSISVNDVNETYVNWLNDPQINQYLETRLSTQNRETVMSFVQATLNTPSEYLFTIRTKNKQHIGNIKIGAINEYHGTAEVSLFIGDKNAWGKGYATLAIKLVNYFAFTTLKLRKLSAGAYQTNIASTKAFINSGYQIDGIKKAHYKSDNGLVDGVFVCLFSNEFDMEQAAISVHE